MMKSFNNNEWKVYLYMGGIVIYYIFDTYLECKKSVIKFKYLKNNQPLNYYESLLKECNTEMDAALIASRYNCFERFLSSFIWPFPMIERFIPNMVIYFNK